MEKHTCKLCSKSFANGRALGGHMRSHMAALAPVPKIEQNESSHSPSSSSSSSLKQDQDEEEEDEESKSLCYGLRENPKKSFRLVDPEFSFAVDAGSIVQDRESETESSKNPFRRRSKRNRSSGPKPNLVKPEFDHEPVSSVSDTTPEEDVALSLMMLSRDIWMREKKNKEVVEEESEYSDEELKLNHRGSKRKFQCGTCRKVFASYQALGGHRASHKKIKGYRSSTTTITITSASKQLQEADSQTKLDDRRIHECPVCFRVFGSGQALGGHKRSHLSVSVSASATATNIGSAKFGDNLIDLNLPAPVDDDDFSQVELSAVSDAEMGGRD